MTLERDRNVSQLFEISARDVITADYTIIMPRALKVIMSCMTTEHDF